jgi:hypothetical protein
MGLEEGDDLAFKQWLVPKIETMYVLFTCFYLAPSVIQYTDVRSSSDVDANVLGDYVVALITTDSSEATVKDGCIKALSEFLQDRE